MKIPRRFELYGSTIKVTRTKSLGETPGLERIGEYNPNTLEIKIKSGLPTDLANHTFWHEWFHAAFDAAGENKLYANEKLVDCLAGLLSQTLKSAK